MHDFEEVLIKLFQKFAGGGTESHGLRGLLKFILSSRHKFHVDFMDFVW